MSCSMRRTISHRDSGCLAKWIFWCNVVSGDQKRPVDGWARWSRFSRKVWLSLGPLHQLILWRKWVSPSQFIDLKALMGDKSDNILASLRLVKDRHKALARTHGSLEGIYENIDGMRLRRWRKISSMTKETNTLSKTLAFYWDSGTDWLALMICSAIMDWCKNLGKENSTMRWSTNGSKQESADKYFINGCAWELGFLLLTTSVKTCWCRLCLHF